MGEPMLNQPAKENKVNAFCTIESNNKEFPIPWKPTKMVQNEEGRGFAQPQNF